LKQTTIAKKIDGVGIGLHKGEPIRFSIEPSDPNSGIIFYKTDTKTYIRACVDTVIDTRMATVIGVD